MLAARTEIPCMLDYDTEVNIYTICKHMLSEHELDHRGAATAQIMFDIQEIKRRHFQFSEQIGNISRRKRKSLHANLKMF